MGRYEVREYLNYLAQDKHVSASTQNQALNALVFLYKNVLQQEIENIDAVRAKRSQRVPVVLTKEEVERVFSFLSGTQIIMATLLYGGGVRRRHHIHVMNRPGIHVTSPADVLDQN
jgi:site-specific recombinase XerD